MSVISSSEKLVCHVFMLGFTRTAPDSDYRSEAALAMQQHLRHVTDEGYETIQDYEQQYYELNVDDED